MHVTSDQELNGTRNEVHETCNLHASTGQGQRLQRQDRCLNPTPTPTPVHCPTMQPFTSTSLRQPTGHSRGVSFTPSRGSHGLDGPVLPEEERNAFRAFLCMAHTRFNPASSGNRWVNGGIRSKMTAADSTFSLPYSEHHGSRRLVPGGPR